ncbi:transglycosylase domain-containing protein [Kitasatospora sp. NPDC054939]
MSERRRRSPGGGDGQRPNGVRETAQQPRMTRAEMRRAGQKGGGRRGGPEPSAGPGKPGKKRFIDYPRFGKQGFRRWLPSWKLILTTFLVFFATGVTGVWIAYANTRVPAIHEILKAQNNIYYWADGSEMTRTGDGNRQIVELGDISPNLRKAVIAAENETFYTDSGIDPKGMARAVLNMATGGETQGASTITQQYVKNAYLTQEQTLTRKVKEFFITLKINEEYSKDEILRDYLNSSWFGRGATGAQAAAQAYYGVNAKDLDICQSAMLAGLLKGATFYDPTVDANKARAEQRWRWILDRMVTTKNATAEERAKCTAFPAPIPRKSSSNLNGQISYLVDTANKFVMNKDKTVTQQGIERGGFRIYTTFQKDRVLALEKAVNDVKGETLNVQKRPEKDKWVQFGAASVEPSTGALVAIYGGDGVENNHFDNNADAQGIQIGSTFKPFVLATAMQMGVQTQKGDDGKPKRINADSRYLSDDLSEIRKVDGSLVIGDDGKPYRQENEDNNRQRGYVSLRQSMQWSYNVPFVQLGQDVGNDNVAKMAEQMGLRKETFAPSNTVTFPLGTSTASPIRMAASYGTFATSGKQADPYSVTKVVAAGRELPGFNKPAVKQALEPAVADNITDVLVNVAKNGTGSKTVTLGRPVAGKTGTTDKNKSAWWVGYTKELSTSIGMWRENPEKHELESLNGTGGKDSIHGGDVPTDIFTRYMKAALANVPKSEFNKPTPVGEQVDSSGAPKTPTMTASPTATETGPSASADPGQPNPQPTNTAPPACVPGVDCPNPDPTPTPTRTNGNGNGGGSGGGGSSPTCGLIPLGCSSPPATSSPSAPGTGKPTRPTSTPTGGAGGAGGNAVQGAAPQ